MGRSCKNGPNRPQTLILEAAEDDNSNVPSVYINLTNAITPVFVTTTTRDQLLKLIIRCV